MSNFTQKCNFFKKFAFFFTKKKEIGTLGLIYNIRRYFMAFISQDEINEIRMSASIVDVISSYIPLTQKGKNYFGVCPFHEDHSPSMSVSEEKQIYKCFSCGATGNVFTFVENYLNISFAEAINLIADKVGIKLQAQVSFKKHEKYQKEYELMDFVLHFFQNNIHSELGKNAKNYLKERHLDEEAISTFDLGLALDKNMLYDILIKKGYQNDTLIELGLITQSEKGIYELFQNRIIFPIHNLEGQVVGFTARSYLENLTPKYLNTKETHIFKKGQILFNYHRARDAIRLKKEVIIVEGNMDAIRLYKSGLKNVIALMGTSITKDQLETLKKLRAKIILMLDNDNAGETATYNIGNYLEENNLNFAIVRLSDAKDPDEYILKYGLEALENNLKNAISFVNFKLNYLKKNKNLNDAKDLAEYLKSVLSSLENTTDEILKEVTLQKLSQDYNISYEVLKEELKNIQPKKTTLIEPKKEESKEKKGIFEKIMAEILFYMMNAPNFIKLYQTKIGVFEDPEYRHIANEITYYYTKHKTINLADFITYAETIKEKDAITKIISEHNNLNLTEESMLELISAFRQKNKKETIKKLKTELQNEYDVHKKIALIEKITEIKKGSVTNEDY